MPRPVFEAQLSGWVKDLLTESKTFSLHRFAETAAGDKTGGNSASFVRSPLPLIARICTELVAMSSLATN
jgi:hypothetical protein